MDICYYVMFRINNRMVSALCCKRKNNFLGDHNMAEIVLTIFDVGHIKKLQSLKTQIVVSFALYVFQSFMKNCILEPKK